MVSEILGFPASAAATGLGLADCAEQFAPLLWMQIPRIPNEAFWHTRNDPCIGTDGQEHHLMEILSALLRLVISSASVHVLPQASSIT